MKEIITDELCGHCNGLPAKYVSKTGKLCCENNAAKCPAIKSKIGSINKLILTQKDSTGLTKARRQAADRKQLAVDSNLPDPYKVAAIKMSQCREQNGSYKTHAAKALNTKSKIGSDGLTTIERSTQKMVATRKSVDESGMSNYDKSAAKGRDTKLADIDEKGRNGFDRMWIKGGQAKPYTGTMLYYRSKLEKQFIDKLVLEYTINWVMDNVKNPKSIPYLFENTHRYYIPDFLIDTTLYEIKSNYTWDDFGSNSRWRNKNIAKLNAALSAGFDVILVLDGIELIWKDYRKQYEKLE